jgi:hypothetical protein
MKNKINAVLFHYGSINNSLDLTNLIIREMMVNTILREIEKHFNLEHLSLNDEKNIRIS